MKQTNKGQVTIDEQAEWLRAMSHPLRLRILKGLMVCECNVGHMWQELGISQPLASQHLNRMRRAGLIIGERRGQEICYRLADPKIARIIELLDE